MTEQQHRIRYAPDEIFGGRDFLMCAEHRDGVTLFLREGMTQLPHAEQAAILEAAWIAYRELMDVPSLPEQRLPRRLIWRTTADLS